MSKIVLNNIADLTSSTTAQTTINNNYATLQTAFDNTLSRDGTSPNQMSSTLDMNSNHVTNLPAPISNFDAVRLLDVTSIGSGGSITVNPLPVGGSVNQALTKNSSTNFDVSWKNVLPVAGAQGQVLTKNSSSDFDVGWQSANVPKNISGNPFTTTSIGGNTDDTNTIMEFILGTSSSPSNPVSPPIISQVWSAVTDLTKITTSILGTAFKTVTNNTAWCNAITGIGVDKVGGFGSFVEGVRGQAYLVAGSQGQGNGLVGISTSNTGIGFAALLGVEGEVDNNSSVDAPVYTSFSSTPNPLSASFLATNRGTHKVDAAYLINPYNVQVFRSGFSVGANTIDSTGAAFVNFSNCAVGLDLSTATNSSLQIKGNAFTVDPSGNLTAFTVSAGANGMQTPILVGGTSAASSLDLRSTSGVGTTDTILFKTGSQLTRMAISTGGQIATGPTPPNSNVGLWLNPHTNSASTTPAGAAELQICGTDGANAVTTIDSFGGNGVITFRTALGTAASRSGLLTNNNISVINFNGWTSGGAYSSPTPASITVSATENWTGSATGSQILFKTCPNTTISPATALIIQNSGGVSVGTATDPGIGSLILNGSLFHPTVANAAIATALTSVGPTGSHTTVQEWFPIKNAAGTIRYVPGF